MFTERDGIKLRLEQIERLYSDLNREAKQLTERLRQLDEQGDEVQHDLSLNKEDRDHLKSSIDETLQSLMKRTTVDAKVEQEKQEDLISKKALIEDIEGLLKKKK
ncbi:hypothetical protein [Exiguobacterium sp. UBA5002]|uniref:hypothetical protein n=1 Tax=Exiguobacterium sp. UBA5002 TaxID=1946497 RepID=UPI0025BCAE51|nr:hypothetical protein [Exiguobacterium sp. UBA5002]